MAKVATDQDRKKLLIEKIPDRPYENVNRTTLKEALKLYICQTPFEELKNIIRYGISRGVYSASLSKLITSIKAISVSSAEGNVLLGGYQHIDKMVVIKYSKDGNTSNVLHEYIMGLILNTIRTNVPHFMYTYSYFVCNEKIDVQRGDSVMLCGGSTNSGHLTLEYVDGNKLGDLLPSLSIQEMGKLYLNIMLSMHIANTKVKFCHYDLHAENILVRTEDRPVTQSYDIDGKIINVNSRYFPTIIDYGFARAEFNGLQFNRPGMNLNIIKNNINAGNENHPLIDWYKLVWHSISSLRYKSAYTQVHQKFFESWINSVQNVMNHSDYVDMRNHTLTTDPIVNDRHLYSYPGFTEVKVENFLYYAQFLLPFASKLVISNVTCPPDILAQIYNIRKNELQHLPCNNELAPSIDSAGSARSIFDCAKYYFDGKYNVVEFDVGVVNDQKAINKVLSEVQPINISFYGDMSIAKEYSSTGNPNFKCGSHCTHAYKVIKKMVLVDMSDPLNLLRLAQNSPSLRFLFLLTLYHGQPYAYNNKQIKIDDGPTITNVLNILDGPASPDKGLLERIIRTSSLQWLSKFSDTNVALKNPDYNSFNRDHPLKRFIAEKLDRYSMRFPDYIFPNELMNMFENSQYAGYSYLPTGNTRNNNRRFGEIVSGKKVKSFLRRDYTNPYDWQYNDDQYLFGEIGKLIRDMKKYTTTNIDFHSGDLVQHSIWTALYIQWMYKTNHPAVKGIEDMRSTMIAVGFLHDIGKGGDMVFSYYDKPDHPLKGYEYLKNKSYNTADGVINLEKVLFNMGIPTIAHHIVEFMVRYHWDIGGVLNECKNDDNKCIDVMYNKFNAMEYPNQRTMKMKAQMFACLYLLWSADLMATQPFIAKDKLDSLSKIITNELANPNAPKQANYYFNEIIEEFPFIANMPKVHRGGNKYDDFRIQDKDATGNYINQGRGLRLRAGVLMKIMNENVRLAQNEEPELIPEIDASDFGDQMYDDALPELPSV